MPTTVNGIGTHYYGKGNRSSRIDICRHCNCEAVLESYDTRLWFVVIFIPFIPLKRLRVIDACSMCGMHMAVDARAYERSRQEAMSAVLSQFRAGPTPETALAAHATLLAFHDSERAAELRRDALARFPNDVALLQGLASHLEEVSATEEAFPLHEATLRLQGELPAARVGVAARRMAEGRFDEARSLLSFLEVAGAGRVHSLEPLRALAGHYQQDGRHPEALRLCEILLREIPKLGQERSFRIFVQKSETGQGLIDSILPPRRRSLVGLFGIGQSAGYARWQRWAAVWGVLFLLAAAALAASNEYFRRNRTIYVVNACGLPVNVQVDGAGPQIVDGLGRLSASEGRHVIKVSGAIEETHEIEMRTSYWDRWRDNPVWVLNPGGEAVVRESTVFYALNPRPPIRGPIALEPFLFRRHVDYAFEPLPESLQLPRGSGEISRIALLWEHNRDAEAFEEILGSDRALAFAFIERRLRRSPEQTRLLDDCMRFALPEELPKVHAFLKAGLERRPVPVPWHRAFQSLAEFEHQDADLIALYDRFVKAEPANSSLLYLRARIEPDWEKQDSIYRRTIELDPRLPWPWMALGARAEAGAHWEEAVRCLLKAHELSIDPALIQSSLQTARLGSGGALALVSELRAQITSQPLDVSAVVSLCEALAASGQAERIDAEINAWQNKATPNVPVEVISAVRAVGLYHAGKLKECADRCRSVASLKSGSLHLQSLLAMKKAKEVTADSGFSRILGDPRIAPCVSLALALENQPDEAARWRDTAIANMKTAARGMRRAAEILAQASPSSSAEFDRLYMDADLKAVVLLLMAERHPERRSEYVASAARFNVRRKPPYHLVRQAIERAPSLTK